MARSLARAFEDDPVMSWLFPAPATRVSHNEDFFRLRLRDLLEQEEVWTTDDHAGAALWTLPDRWRTSPRELLRWLPVMGRNLGRRTPLALCGLAQVERLHPPEPHMYLAVLGTDPARQGEGIGGKLMVPVLEECDRDGVAAYLESSKERNIAFYSRFGFRVTDELDLPRGPRVWGMWRDPL
jgi:ribosomal protein S18 acetylase RimI-like enzyme